MRVFPRARGELSGAEAGFWRLSSCRALEAMKLTAMQNSPQPPGRNGLFGTLRDGRPISPRFG